MRFKKILVLTIAMLMVTLFMTSCGGGGGTEGKTTAYIGLTAPLSGVGGSYGADIKAGLEMAIDKINAGGGVNIGGEDYIFLLKASDDIAVPDQALTNAQGFVLDGIAIREIGKEVALHPVKLVCNNAEIRGSRGDGNAADLFHRLDKDHVVDHRADPADTFCKEHNLLPGATFHDPLYPLLHIPELDLCTDNTFPFCLAFEPGGFLKTGMNRPERYIDIHGPLHGCFSSQLAKTESRTERIA